MNVKAMWLLPLAIAALSLTSTADAEHPSPSATSTSPASTGGLPDLCAELDVYGDPLRCNAVGPGMAPLWDDTACCDGRRCYAPNATGGCWTGTHAYWCESAVQHSTGALDCVYEVPSYCDVHPCGPGDLTAPPLKHAICCHDVGCYDHEGGLCGGVEVWCGKGVSNEDGTVTCLDGEDE
jgi:hypothetical protein